MKTKLPSHPVAATLYADYPHWVLRMTRDFPHEPGRLWEAITKADLVARWAPFRPEHDLISPGDVWLTQLDDGDEPVQGRVIEAHSPSSLIYLWVSDRLRFDVIPTDDGAALGFSHSFDDRNSAASLAAGWHLCFGALELLLDGKEVPSVIGENARAYGWENLERQYAEMLAKNDAAPEPMGDL